MNQENEKKEMEVELDDMDKAAGGKIAKNPNGSCDTLDKYVIVDDNTNQGVAMAGGYSHARKVAQGMGLSTENIDYKDVVKP